MNTLETIVSIFVIIECVQVFFLLRTNKQTKNLIAEVVQNEEYAASVGRGMFWGLIEDVREDPKKQEMLIGFLAWMFQSVRGNIVEGVQGKILDVTKSGKIKPGPGLGDFATQAIQSFLGNLSTNGAKKAAEKVVEEPWY